MKDVVTKASVVRSSAILTVASRMGLRDEIGDGDLHWIIGDDDLHRIVEDGDLHWIIGDGDLHRIVEDGDLHIGVLSLSFEGYRCWQHGAVHVLYWTPVLPRGIYEGTYVLPRVIPGLIEDVINGPVRVHLSSHGGHLSCVDEGRFPPPSHSLEWISHFSLKKYEVLNELDP